jgi:hypothetical protein
MRRTARTHMAALGIDRFVAERALNHKVRDVEGVYNQYGLGLASLPRTV